MRKLCVLVVVIGLPCLTATSAQAAEVRPSEERVELELHAKREFVVYAFLFPQKHVAVVEAQRNPTEALREKGRWMGAAYAVHAPAASPAGRVNLQVGDIAQLEGHFVSSEKAAGRHDRFCRGRRPVTESGHFVGRIAFRGDGGYLRVTRRRVVARRIRSFRLRCRTGHANDHQQQAIPGLFGYIPPPMWISNRDGTFLALDRVTHSRVIHLLAVHRRFEQGSRFEAGVREWLPGKVATSRWVEVSGVAESSFQVDESEPHPRAAEISPPFPFHGEATYRRGSHSIQGDLRVSFLGRSLPIAGPLSQDKLCRRTRKMASWICR